MSKPLVILFEDEHCLAIAKAAGQFPLGTWSPPGETTLEAAVRAHLARSSPGEVYLGIVHRLDRPTSGVLIWAKTPKAARRLSRQFEARRAIKEYWAVVAPSGDEGRDGHRSRAVRFPHDARSRETWSDWVTRPDRAGMVRIVDSGTEGAREAITQVTVGTARSLPEACAWLRLWPRTGRAHQLRVQAAARNIPILGDAMYGSDCDFEPAGAIALHAHRLQVFHPVTGAELALTAPLPDEWTAQGIIL